MSPARQGPIEVVGPVKIYGPTPSRPRYRLKWAEIAEQFVAQGRSPYDRRPWAKSYAVQVADHMNRMMRRYGDRLAMDLDRDLCELLRAEAGTDNGVRANTTDLRAFLAWGAHHPQRYFTLQQSELIPLSAVRPQPALAGTSAPSRRTHARNVGASEQYISDEDAPSLENVRRLSTALGERIPAWGALAPEFAMCVGPRWGEQFQVTADDIHLEGCAHQQGAHVHIRAQIDAGASAADRAAGQSRCEPKGRKQRTVAIPLTSLTGYALHDAVGRRVAAARQEQLDGTNPEALLFPAAEGGLLWYSAFNTDHLRPAMIAAGWRLVKWVQTHSAWDASMHQYTVVERDRVMSQQPWHGLRHRFARTMIDHYGMKEGQLMAAGGWENIETVSARYYRSGDEHTQAAMDAVHRRDHASAPESATEMSSHATALLSDPALSAAFRAFVAAARSQVVDALG